MAWVARAVLVAVLVSGGAACAATSGYPGALPDPQQWPENFSVRQSIAIRATRGDAAAGGQFDAVMQKQGDTLVIVGLGPMSSRAFTLSQRGSTVELVASAGFPQLPFPPRYILIDAHRIFLFPPLAGAGSDVVVVRGQRDGEEVEERWEHGELKRRSFTRPGTNLTGAVRIEYGAGCRVDRCHPDTVTLSNEWIGYILTITSQDYEALE